MIIIGYYYSIRFDRNINIEDSWSCFCRHHFLSINQSKHLQTHIYLHIYRGIEIYGEILYTENLCITSSTNVKKIQTVVVFEAIII